MRASTGAAPAEAANPGVAPAPAPVVAPVEDKQPVNAAAVTGHTLPINKIKNFKLADQNGKAYELYKMTDAKAIVLTMHTKGCPIGQQLQPDVRSSARKAFDQHPYVLIVRKCFHCRVSPAFSFI